jgi:hypothetical protein
MTKKESKNKYFHCQEKGCIIKPLKNKERQVRCETHNVLICKCGWQEGHHFGFNT